MHGLTEEFNQNSQIDTQADIEDEPGVELPVAVAIYHIAHESLSNMQKHAAASRVAVSLRFADCKGWLEIKDDGIGFDTSVSPPEGHRGMRNMAARERAIGATFRVESRPRSGTELSVEFPVGQVVQQGR